MNLTPRFCLHCGEEILVAYRVTAEYWATRKYCSPKCSGDASQGRPSHRKGKTLIPLETRFWEKVAKGTQEECWIWTGARERYGYGYLVKSDRPRRNLKAHRLSYELAFGPIPQGMNVLHRCDNPPCVNPSHLFLGSIDDNNKDRGAKGRGAPQQGAANHHAKLTEANVTEMHRLRAEGWPQQRIADHFGIRQGHVSRILRGLAWKGDGTN